MLQSPDPLLPLTAARSPWLRGTMAAPGDATAAQLALLLAGLAEGESTIGNVPDDPAVEAMARALGQLGVATMPAEGGWHVRGLGLPGVLEADGPIDLSELGDGATYLIALLAAHDMETVFAGVAVTPGIDVLLHYLHRTGCLVTLEGGRLAIRGPRFSVPLEVALTVEAAPLIGPLLVNALASAGRSTLHLPAEYTDPAQHLIASFGGKFAGDATKLSLEGLTPLAGQTLDVPTDPTLAALPLAAAMVAADSEITVPGVALSASGRSLLTALQLLGADLTLTAPARGGEGLVDITARHAPLRPATIPASLMLPTDDLTIVAVVAAFAQGETRLENFGGGLRRLTLTRALRANGIDCAEEEAGALVVRGAGRALVVRGAGRAPGGGNVATRLDPKLAMAFLVLGLGAERPVTIDDGGMMLRRFPNFLADLEHLGAKFTGAGW